MRSHRPLAFTLLELLLVTALVAVLAALLLPALSAAKRKAGRMACANHLKQLSVAAQLYAAENDGRLPENLPNVPPARNTNLWVLGNVASPAEATNEHLLRLGRLFPYVPQPRVYRCPADSPAPGESARVRSYAMNGWVGSRYLDNSSGNKFRTFLRESELAAAVPASIWMLLDEHRTTIDDGWFLVTMDDSRPFASAPASRHERGYGLSFADGHVELYKLRDPESDRLSTPTVQISPRNSDWIRLKSVTTVR